MWLLCCLFWDSRLTYIKLWIENENSGPGLKQAHIYMAGLNGLMWSQSPFWKLDVTQKDNSLSQKWIYEQYNSRACEGKDLIKDHMWAH
jgi:hypothetical protein